MRKTLLLFSLILCAVNGYSQPFLTIGTGTVNNTTTTYPAPYGNWFWGARHQMLILATELQAAGAAAGDSLNAIQFDVVNEGGAQLIDFEIRIGHTTQSDMSTWVLQSQLTSVFNAPIYTENIGWNNHQFNAPFVWNGLDNLVVETCFNNSSFSSNAILNQSNTSFISTRWYRSDAFGVCSNTAQTGTASQRPNMRLTFPPQPFDAGVIEILQPIGTTIIGQSVPVEVVVKNFGQNSISNFDVEYTINGVVSGNSTVTSSIAPDSTAIISLPAFTSPSGLIDICIYSSLSGDGYTLNDTICESIFGISVIDVDYFAPYSENFDGVNQTWIATTGTSTATNWELGTPDFGLTNSAHSPPNSWDINLSSAYQPNAAAYLTSPYFNFSNAVSSVLSFYQNRNTQTNFDGTRLEYSVNNGPWQLLGTTSTGTNWYNSSVSALGSSGWSGSSNGWINSSIDLPNDFNNQALVQFRFFFASNTTTQWDGISIDNFEITVPPALSVSSQNLQLLNNLLIPGTPQVATVEIRNHGTSSLQNVKVTLEVDGNVIVTDNLSFIPPLDGYPTDSVYHHTFSQPWISTSGTHTVKAYTSLPNLGTDQNLNDDTTTIVVNVLGSLGPPYCDDYEGSHPQWITLNALSYSNSTNWEIGTPAQTFLDSAFNGNNAWMINLDQNYGQRDSSGLYTPVFVLSGNQCYKLNFQHIFSTELYHDGGTVEYSIDGTLTWHSIGSHTQPNWYNMQYIASLGNNPPRPGWSGQSNGWELAENFIGFTTPQSIIFRFRFASDMTTHDEGWAIDQFCFEEDPSGQCVLLTDIELINSPSGLVLDQNYPNPANNSTIISYILPDRGDVSLVISNMLGQQLKVLQSGVQDSGPYSIQVDLNDLNAGLYFYTLVFKNEEQMVKKMVVTK